MFTILRAGEYVVCGRGRGRGGGRGGISLASLTLTFCRVGSIFSPAPTPKPKELSRRNKARLKQKMDGGVRICAHVALPSASLHKSKNTPSTATSNVRISGNNVELGMIKENDLELLRVDFSRVFAYHHGGNVEAFFNRNVTGEVRPWVRNAVRGEGPGVVVVLSVGVGGRTVGSKGSASMSTAFLEGEEGDTGVMYDCIDAVFEEIDKVSVWGVWCVGWCGDFNMCCFCRTRRGTTMVVGARTRNSSGG